MSQTLGWRSTIPVRGVVRGAGRGLLRRVAVDVGLFAHTGRAGGNDVVPYVRSIGLDEDRYLLVPRGEEPGPFSVLPEEFIPRIDELSNRERGWRIFEHDAFYLGVD